MERGKRGKKERGGRHGKGRGWSRGNKSKHKTNSSLPNLSDKAKISPKDPVLEMVRGMKMLGDVHSVALSRVHMRASADEPLNILISPLLFRYMYNFECDDSRSTEPVKELGLAYYRLFQIFEETDYIPPIPVNIPYTNKAIESFTTVNILPGLLYHTLFQESMPDELKGSKLDSWINSEDNMRLVPFVTENQSLILLTGSDACVHHESNLTVALVNSALVYYNIISKLHIPVSKLCKPEVQIVVRPKRKSDPEHLTRILLAVSVMSIPHTRDRDTEKILSEKFVTPEEQEEINGKIGWCYSSKERIKK